MREVGEFLEKLNLTMYKDALFEQGYIDMTTLREVEDRELEAVGMRKGHIRRFRRAVAEAAAGAAAGVLAEA